MMPRPEVSLVVPSYNAGDELAQTSTSCGHFFSTSLIPTSSSS